MLAQADTNFPWGEFPLHRMASWTGIEQCNDKRALLKSMLSSCS